MKITDVKIYKVDKKNLLAFANITIDGEFVVHGFRVVEGRKGPFVACPSAYSEKDKEYYDTAFPVTKDCREYLTKCVLDAYDSAQERRR